MQQTLNSIRNKAENIVPDCETWPSQYRLRAKELEVIQNYFDIGNVGKILEIGCGNAFNSAMLANFCNSIVALDLPKFDIKTHTIGMEKANKLIRKLNISNCDLIGASADKLPFSDCSFDLIFAEYVVEHLADKKKALYEFRRVLKNDGYFINIVPNFVERIFYPPVFYAYLIKRAVYHLFNRRDDIKDNIYINDNYVSEKISSKQAIGYKKFRQNYPHFPFPEPHGCYSNYFIETYHQLPNNWLTLHNNTGFKVVDIFTTMLFPFNFFGIFCDALTIYENSGNKRYGRYFPLKYLGQNICFVCKKI